MRICWAKASEGVHQKQNGVFLSFSSGRGKHYHNRMVDVAANGFNGFRMTAMGEKREAKKQASRTVLTSIAGWVGDVQQAEAFRSAIREVLARLKAGGRAEEFTPSGGVG